MKQPYLLFLGTETDTALAKTSAGIAYWRPEICKGQYRMTENTVDLGLPDMDIDGAVAAGVKTIIIGIAPCGGSIADDWVPIILEALEKGIDIAAGLHHRLNDHPEISALAKEKGRALFDVRQPTEIFDVASGRKRSGKRLLTVGSDCAVGKMYASLALEKEMKKRGFNADFRATGQTGIFITGQGVSVDAVVSDFVSGATETLSPDNDENHWDLIEGQGSLYHPAYAGVTVGLVHGSQPDVMVLCHDVSRSHIDEYPDFPIPELGSCMEGYLTIARLTNPNTIFAGICINSSKLSEEEAMDYMRVTSEKYGLPCCDPVRTGVAAIIDRLEKIS